MSKVLEAAKAVVSAIVTAAVAALAGVDWLAIIGAAAASGGLTYRVPNKRKRR